MLAENYNEDEFNINEGNFGEFVCLDKEEEYLQRHLYNSASILNLMDPKGKPLLLILTDATSSLMASPFCGKLDPLIQKLLSNDVKIITVDLGDENKVANTFGYINHNEHLKYLAYLTRGAHFDYT